MKQIHSEMSACVWKVIVAPGDHVEIGDTVIILESMKMEIPVVAQTSGTVVETPVLKGQLVAEGDVVAVLD